MRHRSAALIASLLAVLTVGGWLIKRRIDANDREHGASLARASQEPGVLILDPKLDPGVVEVTLIPAGPGIELSAPATIRVGQESRRWSAGSWSHFEGLDGKRDQPVSVLGEYLVEGASLNVPPGGSGARVALRALPIDPPTIGVPFEKQLEISTTDPSAIIIVWKQSNIVVSEVKVPRGGPRDALATEVQKEWTVMGSHRDPSDRMLDRAVVRIEPGSPFQEIFPLVDAILATKRTTTLGGEARSLPAFNVSVQPALPLPPPRSNRDVGR